MYNAAVGASSTDPTPTISSGCACAQCLTSAEKTSIAKSPRLVNSSTRAPPLYSAAAICRAVSTSAL